MTQTGTKLGVSITTRDARTRALTGSPRLSLRHKHARPTITNVLKRESRVPSDARRQLGTAVHPPTAATLRNGLNDRNRPNPEIRYVFEGRLWPPAREGNRSHSPPFIRLRSQSHSSPRPRAHIDAQSQAAMSTLPVSPLADFLLPSDLNSIRHRLRASRSS